MGEICYGEGTDFHSVVWCSQVESAGVQRWEEEWGLHRSGGSSPTVIPMSPSVCIAQLDTEKTELLEKYGESQYQYQLN